jgi:predicted Rossmann fold flavoprotein
MNFFPSYSEEELFSLLETRWQHRPDRRLGFSFVGLLPDRFAPAILTEYGFDPERVVAQIGKKERRLIAECFQNVKLTLDGVRSYSESQVTAGGVDTSEVNPKTMESRLVPGLYFVGEVLDIDGDSGGFNLQFAFSTAAMLE